MGLHSCDEKHTKNEAQVRQLDSLISGATKSDLTAEQELANLQIAYKKISELGNDSLQLSYYNKIALDAASKGDSSFFLTVAAKGLELAGNRNDSVALGYAHWNYGVYYLKRNRFDSSYAHYRSAYKYFENSDRYYAGKMLYNMAYIGGRLKDYTLSEMLLYKAIKLFEAENKYSQLYLCYNHLGVLYKNLEEYEEALSHYSIALEYWEQSEREKLHLLDLQNNMGVVHQKMGNQERAIHYFDAALYNEELKTLDAALYARVIDNRAFSLMLMGNMKTLPEEFHRALKVRDSIGNEEGRVMSYLHFAKYALKMDEKGAAKMHASKAFEIANRINLRRDALEALLLLAEAHPEEKLFYLSEHIQLNDRLNQEERRIRNKFAKIQFETETYINRNIWLQKTRLWIIIGSLLAIIILVLTVILIRQRARTKALEFETRQQIADQKIYLLTLKEQANLERGMFKERRRISEELHDGILGRLLGIRVNWERLQLEGDPEAIAEHQNLLYHLGLVEKEIRSISHDLQNEIMLIDTRFVRWMEKLTKDRAGIGNFEYTFYADSLVDWERFDDYFKTNVYRILEEALQNCIKHAEANTVNVWLKGEQEFVVLEVADNGKGYSGNKRAKGIGIRNMESRAKKLDGILTINSYPGEGTTLTVKIPNKEMI